MKKKFILGKIEEAKQLLKDVDPSYRDLAFPIVLEKLVNEDEKSISKTSSVDTTTKTKAPIIRISKITSIRRLRLFVTKLNGPKIALTKGWFIVKANRDWYFNSKELKKDWELVTNKKFNTTHAHRCEEKGWLEPVLKDGKQIGWKITDSGLLMVKTIIEAGGKKSSGGALSERQKLKE